MCVPGLPIGPSVLFNVYITISGCKEDGECKPVGSVWRKPGECAKFKCVMGECDDGSIETDIEEYVGKFSNTWERNVTVAKDRESMQN